MTLYLIDNYISRSVGDVSFVVMTSLEPPLVVRLQPMPCLRHARTNPQIRAIFIANIKVSTSTSAPAHTIPMPWFDPVCCRTMGRTPSKTPQDRATVLLHAVLHNARRCTQTRCCRRCVLHDFKRRLHLLIGESCSGVTRKAGPSPWQAQYSPPLSPSFFSPSSFLCGTCFPAILYPPDCAT